MKWHSLLKDPNDLPQKINKYDESEDVMVIERRLHDVYGEKAKFDYVVLGNPCYYGHWKPNGEEGWRVRGKDLSDCGKFGGFDTDVKYSETESGYLSMFLTKHEVDNIEDEDVKSFIKENCPYDEQHQAYITRSIVGWAYYPNEEDFIEENKDLL